MAGRLRYIGFEGRHQLVQTSPPLPKERYFADTENTIHTWRGGLGYFENNFATAMLQLHVCLGGHLQMFKACRKNALCVRGIDRLKSTVLLYTVTNRHNSKFISLIIESLQIFCRLNYGNLPAGCQKTVSYGNR